MKKQKGITLISLIITIIVMVILAGIALAFSVGENGVITKVEEAKEKTEIAMEKEKLQDAVFATIGRSGKVELDNIVLPEGFTEISREENKVVYQGPTGQQYEVENGTGKTIEIEVLENLEITTDTQGVTFTKSDGVTPGDSNNLKNGDIVIYGDYRYTYSNNNQGWSVAVLDKTKEQYGKIAEDIYGKPTTYLGGTFKNCTNLKIAPIVPQTVTNMDGTFQGCLLLKKAPKIPDGVTSLAYTFGGCNSLEEAPKIPNGVVNMHSTFVDCTILKEAPKIPDGVTNMSTTFGNCISLIVAPEIPDSVITMTSTFSKCYKLQGEIIINALPTTYIYCFYDVGTKSTGIVLKGSSTVLTELAETKNNGKVTVGN